MRWCLFQKVLRTIEAAQTGHIGACCSSLDLMAVLYFSDLIRIDSKDPKHPLRDYVLNRGHLGPLKYNIFSLLGWLSEDEMFEYRQFGSRLAGHEDMKLTPGVDISPNGSLGMTLSYAVGAAIGFRDCNMPNRVFCFLGDGEEQEGNVSEAARHAAHLKLPRLICIIDRNGGQLSARLKDTDSVDLHKVWEGYGWQVLEISNGHDIAEIYNAYRKALELAEAGPVCVIANTVKGYGIPGCIDDYCGFHVFHNSEHGEAVRSIKIDEALEGVPEKYIGNVRFMIPSRRLPEAVFRRSPEITDISLEPFGDSVMSYDVEHRIVSILEQKLGDGLYVFTADYPPRSLVYDNGRFPFSLCHYYNVGLREQHMTAMVHGLMQVRKDALCVVLCGDAFLYRHMDQINVLAQAGTRVIFYSVQGGISGARNGSTHQSSGQTGALLMMPGIEVEEPCSAEDIIDATNRAFHRSRPTYIRFQKLPSRWKLGGQRKEGYEVVSFSHEAEGTIVSCGMTTVETVKALHTFERMGRVWNLINVHTLSACPGLDSFILPAKPLHLYYNGASRVLLAAISGEICRMSTPPSKISSWGFDLGVTGSIEEIMRHFELDAGSVVKHCVSGVD